MYIKKVKGGTHPLRDLYEKVLSTYIEKVKGRTRHLGLIGGLGSQNVF